MGNSVILLISLQIFLIALNAIFASAEIAVISLNESKLQKLAKSGDKKAIKLLSLTAQPARFLATIQIAITLSGYLGSAFAAENFSDGIALWLLSLGAPFSLETLDTFAVIVITLILSYFTLIFGELVPKRIAMEKSESLALALATLLTAIAKIFKPIVSLLTFSTNIILRFIGIDPDSQDDEVSEEEIRMLVDVGNQKGAIDYHEKQFIQNVFEFDDLSASDIATHRKKIALLWMDESLEDWDKTIHNARHTLYPICDQTADNIIGILNAKDYFRLHEKTQENILNHAVSLPYFIPGTVKADILFKNMKRYNHQLAIVLDEYGGLIGIVTINDLVEQLVGDLDSHQLQVLKLEEHKWQIQGATPLDIVSNELMIALPDDQYDTFNGFILGTLQTIPEDGTHLELSSYGLHIQITEIKEHQVISTVVSIDTQ